MNANLFATIRQQLFEQNRKAAVERRHLKEELERRRAQWELLLDDFRAEGFSEDNPAHIRILVAAWLQKLGYSEVRFNPDGSFEASYDATPDWDYSPRKLDW